MDRSKRGSPEQRAADAEFVLEHPAFTSAWEQARENIVRKIEDLDVENRRTEHELCVMLRSLKLTRKLMERTIQHGDAKLRMDKQKLKVV